MPQPQPQPRVDHSTAGYIFVSTPQQLEQMLDALSALERGPGAALAIDCEGVNLGRPGGSLTLLQLAAQGVGRGGRGVTIWVVDLQELGWRALNYHAPRDAGTSLRSLLEDEVRTAFECSAVRRTCMCTSANPACSTAWELGGGAITTNLSTTSIHKKKKNKKTTPQPASCTIPGP